MKEDYSRYIQNKFRGYFKDIYYPSPKTLSDAALDFMLNHFHFHEL